LIVIVVAVVLVLLAMAAGFIFSSKYAERISRVFLDLNPFKPERDSGDGGELGTPSSLNETENESEVSGGGGTTPAETTEAEEVSYGTGALSIINKVPSLGTMSFAIVHRSEGLEGYDSKDSIYYAMFDPDGKSSKIISNITGYELDLDARPLNSLSTIYLELSLHSQSGGALSVSNVTNELRLSIDPNNKGWNFANKTLTLQQYNPSNTSESFPSYDVRDVIENDGGVIVLARLDGSYDSELPYAWFRVGFR